MHIQTNAHMSKSEATIKSSVMGSEAFTSPGCCIRFTVENNEGSADLLIFLRAADEAYARAVAAAINAAPKPVKMAEAA